MKNFKLYFQRSQIKNIRSQHPCHRNGGCIDNAFFLSKIRIFKKTTLFSNNRIKINNR